MRHSSSQYLTVYARHSFKRPGMTPNNSFQPTSSSSLRSSAAAAELNRSGEPLTILE